MRRRPRNSSCGSGNRGRKGSIAGECRSKKLECNANRGASSSGKLSDIKQQPKETKDKWTVVVSTTMSKRMKRRPKAHIEYSEVASQLCAAIVQLATSRCQFPARSVQCFGRINGYKDKIFPNVNFSFCTLILQVDRRPSCFIGYPADWVRTSAQRNT